MLNKKIADIEKYVRELEADANKIKTKNDENGIRYLIDQSDARLIMEIVNDLKEVLEVE